MLSVLQQFHKKLTMVTRGSFYPKWPLQGPINRASTDASGTQVQFREGSNKSPESATFECDRQMLAVGLYNKLYPP